MYIRDLFEEKKPVISFEIFPPKRNYPIETIYETKRPRQQTTRPHQDAHQTRGGRTHRIQIQPQIRYQRQKLKQVPRICSSQNNHWPFKQQGWLSAHRRQRPGLSYWHR